MDVNWIVKGLAIAASAFAGFRLLSNTKGGHCVHKEGKKKPKLDLVRDRNPTLGEIKMDQKEFVELLSELVGYSKKLQNALPSLVPEESLVADAVLRFLKPYIEPAGPLKVKELTYVKGRSNLIIEYPSAEPTDRVVSFVGAHMDVVPANPDDWSRDPFSLSQEGDVLYGRGVTDCLGHVASFACFFKELAIRKPKLKVRVVAVMIADEESAHTGVGIDMMQKHGELDFLKHGPLYWVDSANFGPTIGTGGMLCWSLTAVGKKFHSGFPNKAINPIPLAFLGLRRIQERFYRDFAALPEHKEYLYQVGSSLKPTQVSMVASSINQIPQSITISGDVRFTPFWSAEEIKRKIESYVHEIDVTQLQDACSYSSFDLPEEKLKGQIQWRWIGEGMEGVACNIYSPSYEALTDAIKTVTGKSEPFSLTGSLPIIRDLFNAGYDLQITGFGRLDGYHAANEFGRLSEFGYGVSIMARIVSSFDATIA